jgi:predicted amidohydrolase
MKVAAIQINGTERPFEKQKEYIADHIATAAKQGAQLLALPEALFGPWIPGVNDVFLGSSLLQFFSSLAKENKLWICPGTLWEKSPDPEKVYNTAFLFDPQGKLRARYRKIHLFDVTLSSGISFHESKKTYAGTKPETVQTDFGLVGFGICFDIRFADLFVQMSKKNRVDMLIIPNNFTYETGRHHFEVLLRARAIENQVFILAPNQYGPQKENSKSFGTSLILDPFGSVLAMAPTHEAAIIYAECDFQKQRELRERFPMRKLVD